MNKLIAITTAIITTINSIPTGGVLAWEDSKTIVSEHSIDLENKMDRASADNILLALRYINGDTDVLEHKNKPDFWEKVRQENIFVVILQPGEVFAFHSEILPEFEGKIVIMPAVETSFSSRDGYKLSGNLVGNGVCFLASLINQTASDAGLTVTALVNHNFFPVPDVPREYGTSIFYQKNAGFSQKQNLYVENNQEDTVELVFRADENRITVSIVK